MKKHWRKLILTSCLLVAILFPAFAFSSLAYGDDLLNGSSTAACNGVGLGGNACTSINASGGINSIIHTVVEILSYTIGVASVIVIIIQGFRFITSGGDPNTIASARNAILYAVAGIFIAIVAQLIIHYVIARGAGNP